MRAATIAALFGEGILVTLNATKLIMYWGGVTSIIIAFPTTKVCINMKKFQNIYYTFFEMKYNYMKKINTIFRSYITTYYKKKKKTPILYL